MMLLGSTEHVSDVVRFVILTEHPVELITEHQGANVNINEHDSSSGFCEER